MTLFFSLWFPYFFSFFSVRDGSAWPGHEKNTPVLFFSFLFLSSQGKTRSGQPEQKPEEEEDVVCLCWTPVLFRKTQERVTGLFWHRLLGSPSPLLLSSPSAHLSPRALASLAFVLFWFCWVLALPQHCVVLERGRVIWTWRWRNKPWMDRDFPHCCWGHLSLFHHGSTAGQDTQQTTELHTPLICCSVFYSVPCYTDHHECQKMFFSFYEIFFSPCSIFTGRINIQ